VVHCLSTDAVITSIDIGYITRTKDPRSRSRSQSVSNRNEKKQEYFDSDEEDSSSDEEEVERDKHRYLLATCSGHHCYVWWVIYYKFVVFVLIFVVVMYELNGFLSVHYYYGEH